MKQILLVSAIIISFCFADSFSDNPEANPSAKVTQETSICPDCGEDSCIYKQINEEVQGEGTDQEIYNAATRVFILRDITDSATIKLILSNYYL